MHTRKKIYSYSLLAFYLLVVLHQSTLHTHSPDIAKPSNTHHHEDFQDVHHEHQFHVGIFHFLGHLFENINHSDHLADEHLMGTQNTPAKKVFDQIVPVNFYYYSHSLVVFSVDAESLPDPPYHLSYLQKLKLPNTPLRAPPSIV